MIPINCNLTVTKTKLDNWGVGVEDFKESYEGYMSYSLNLRGNEINTQNATIESIPVGSVIVKGNVTISQVDNLEWLGNEGKMLKAKPSDVIYIKDSNGKVAFTKVAF